jgi:hypothetical protein
MAGWLPACLLCVAPLFVGRCLAAWCGSHATRYIAVPGGGAARERQIIGEAHMGSLEMWSWQCRAGTHWAAAAGQGQLRLPHMDEHSQLSSSREHSAHWLAHTAGGLGSTCQRGHVELAGACSAHGSNSCGRRRFSTYACPSGVEQQ